MQFPQDLVEALKEGRQDEKLRELSLSFLHHKDSEGWTLLHHAAGACNGAMVQYLMSQGADVEAADEHGWTPLMVAVSTTGADSCAEALLWIGGANVDATTRHGNSPLRQALVGDRSPRLVRVVLAHAFATSRTQEEFRARIEATGWGAHRAALTRNASLVDESALRGLRIDSSEPEDGFTAVHVAALLGDLATMRLLLHHGAVAGSLDGRGRCALFHLYYARPADRQQQQRRLAIARMLIAEGVPSPPDDLTTDGELQLSRMLTNGCTGAIELALSRISIDTLDDGGNTLFHILSANDATGTVDIVKSLNRDFNVNEVNFYGESVLWAAARHGNADATKYWLEQNADPNLRTHRGYTPLLEIFELPRDELTTSHSRCVCLLLSHGANPQLRVVTNDGALCTIVELATWRGHTDLLCHTVIVQLAREEARNPDTIVQWMRESIASAPEVDVFFKDSLKREKNALKCQKAYRLLNLYFGKNNIAGNILRYLNEQNVDKFLKPVS